MDEAAFDLRGVGRDAKAFERFYREHVESVQRFVSRRVDDPYLAADLTADVFVAVIASAKNYRGTAKPVERAWLFGIARNVVAKTYRSRQTERRLLDRVAGRRLIDSDDLARLEERIVAEAQVRELYRALDELPEGERAVLELVAVDGLSLAEAALALGIRSVTARVRLHRARKRLRAKLAPFAADVVMSTEV